MSERNWMLLSTIGDYVAVSLFRTEAERDRRFLEIVPEAGQVLQRFDRGGRGWEEHVVEDPWVAMARTMIAAGKPRSVVIRRLVSEGAWMHVAEDIVDTVMKEQP